jgi:hypothetical protein
MSWKMRVAGDRVKNCDDLIARQFLSVSTDNLLQFALRSCLTATSKVTLGEPITGLDELYHIDKLLQGHDRG